MDSNALYYTFSTIAQTLGGAIALLGALVFYRLQPLNASIAAFVTQQILPHSGQMHHELEELHVRGDYESFVQTLGPSPTLSQSEHLRLPFARLDALVRAKSSLVSGFRRSLGLTVGTCIFSVTSLAAVPHVSPNVCLATALLVLGIFLFVGCLFTYMLLLRSDLK